MEAVREVLVPTWGLFLYASYWGLPMPVYTRLEADWSLAVLMPALHNELKCIVVDTFNPHQFQRLGVLRAEVRRRLW